MTERKTRRPHEDVAGLEVGETFLVLEPTQVEVGSGYAVAVTYDENEHPVVNVKIYGQVDFAQVRRMIERTFPNAQIRRFNEVPSVLNVKICRAKRASRKK